MTDDEFELHSNDTFIDVTVTYLEMLGRGPVRPSRHRAESVAVMRARPPTVAFYRFLYNHVGSACLWYERRLWSDEKIAATVQHEDVHVYVLHVDGTPAGYCELDAREPNQVEIAYFGVMPEFIGRGLGRYWLEWTVDAAWALDPQRVWLHTCTLDHPAALPLYQKLGFLPYEQRTERIPDPRPVVEIRG